MKKLLTDRRFAAGVLAAAVLLFTPLGARMSLKRAVGRVEEQFFTGVEGRGAIADYLGDAEDVATGLLSVGIRYEAAEEETMKLRADRHRLQEVMAGEKLSAYASANSLMVRSFDALREKLLSLELSEDDAASLDFYAAQFAGAQGAIGHAGYNEAAEAFIEDTYDRFPAKLIGQILGVAPPEKFQ